MCDFCDGKPLRLLTEPLRDPAAVAYIKARLFALERVIDKAMEADGYESPCVRALEKDYYHLLDVAQLRVENYGDAAKVLEGVMK